MNLKDKSFIFFAYVTLKTKTANSYRNNLVYLKMPLPLRYLKSKTLSTSPRAKVRSMNGVKEMQLLR